MLEFLDLEANRLVGTVPAPIFNISRLYAIFLGGNNKLTGHIPGNGSFGLPVLQYFCIQQNNFTGQIPAAFSSCRYLRVLVLPDNSFESVVPIWLGKLTHLSFLSLGGNNLFGTIPVFLANLTLLQWADRIHSGRIRTIEPTVCVASIREQTNRKRPCFSW